VVHPAQGPEEAVRVSRSRERLALLSFRELMHTTTLSLACYVYVLSRLALRSVLQMEPSFVYTLVPISCASVRLRTCCFLHALVMPRCCAFIRGVSSSSIDYVVFRQTERKREGLVMCCSRVTNDRPLTTVGTDRHQTYLSIDIRSTCIQGLMSKIRVCTIL
jgi:hypothetical protein